VCSINVQAIDTISDFFIAIQRELPSNVRGRWQSLVEGSKQVPSKILNAIQRLVKGGVIPL